MERVLSRRALRCRHPLQVVGRVLGIGNEPVGLVLPVSTQPEAGWARYENIVEVIFKTISDNWEKAKITPALNIPDTGTVKAKSKPTAPGPSSRRRCHLRERRS